MGHELPPDQAHLWEQRPRASRPEPPRPIRPHPVDVRVKFSKLEHEWFRFDGERRQEYAVKNKAKMQFGDALTNARNVPAATAEAAVAKQLNVYWHPTPWIRGAADVAGFIEVRWTEHHAGAKLPVRPDDDETRIFMLVSGDESNGGYYIRGWIYGWEAKRREWASNPADGKPPAWLMPVEFLRDLETLPDVHGYRLIGHLSEE